jgi:integrase
MSSNGRRGSVKQAENGTWFFILDVPSTELGANGRPKRKQTRRRGFKTRREAQAELTRVLGTLEQAAYVAPKNQALGDYLEHTWLPAIEHTVKLSSFQGYRRTLRRHVIGRPIGMRQLQQIDGPALNAHYALLMAGDGTFTPLSAKTVRYISAILHRAFKDAMRWQAVARNPVEASDPPGREALKEMATWSNAQLDRFLEVASQHRHSAIWWLLATAGMRRGEALGLKWGDINWEKNQVTIRRALIITDKGTRTWSTPKTKAGVRTVSLDDDTMAALKVHRSRQNAEKLALGAGYADEDLITAQVDGSSVSPTRITEQFGRLLRRAGLPHIRLHDLRHTHATLGLEAGVHPKVMQERLGHSHVSVTLGMYSHVTASMANDAAQVMAAMRKASREGAS